MCCCYVFSDKLFQRQHHGNRRSIHLTTGDAFEAHHHLALRSTPRQISTWFSSIINILITTHIGKSLNIAHSLLATQTLRDVKYNLWPVKKNASIDVYVGFAWHSLQMHSSGCGYYICWRHRSFLRLHHKNKPDTPQKFWWLWRHDQLSSIDDATGIGAGDWWRHCIIVLWRHRIEVSNN